MVSFPRLRLPAGVIVSMPGRSARGTRDLGRGVIGEAQQEPPAALLVLRDAAQHFLFQLRAHPRQRAQFLFPAQAFQIVHRLHLEMFEEQRNTLRPQTLNLQEFERRRRKLLQQFVALIESPSLADLLQHRCQALANAGDVGNFALRVGKNVGDSFRIAFDGRRSVAVASGCENRPRPRSPSDRRFRTGCARIPDFPSLQCTRRKLWPNCFRSTRSPLIATFSVAAGQTSVRTPIPPSAVSCLWPPERDATARPGPRA